MTPEEILIEQNIPYTQRGKDFIISCLSPNHEDSNPSMHVDKTLGIAHCFSCGSNINLYTRFNKILSTLGIKQQNILDMIREITITKQSLPIDHNPLTEEFRGISAETFKHFEVFKSEKDFIGRVVLPIKNFKHDIVAFIGRYQYSNADPKYKVYPSGAILPLFPPAVDIDSESIVLVEGMFDMLNLYENGITNVVCGFGLVTPNKKDKYNAKLHDRFISYKIGGVNKIYIMYDGDEPGRKAAFKLENALEGFIATEIIELKNGEDPGDMSSDRIKEILNERY